MNNTAFEKIVIYLYKYRNNITVIDSYEPGNKNPKKSDKYDNKRNNLSKKTKQKQDMRQVHEK